MQALRRIVQRSQSLSQEELIDQLNPVIYGWTLYYRTVVSKKQFTVCDYLLTRMLWQKMTRKHPKKSAKWVKKHYWRTIQGNTWTFATPEETTRQTLRWHAATPIQRHIKVKGQASPFDGNLLYWAKRLKDHPLTKTTLGKLLQKQQGKCRWCELFFREEDQIEIDYITPKSEGGGEELEQQVRSSPTLSRPKACQTRQGVSVTTDCILEEPCEATSLTHGFGAERRGRSLRLGSASLNRSRQFALCLKEEKEVAWSIKRLLRVLELMSKNDVFNVGAEGTPAHLQLKEAFTSSSHPT